MQTGIGPKRNHSEACRVRLESQIALDPEDKRLEQAKERQDHYVFKVHEEDEKQKVNPVVESDADPHNVPLVEPSMVVDDEPGEVLEDAPNAAGDVRVARTPERNSAAKRVGGSREEEPVPKRMMMDPDAPEEMEINDGIDVDVLNEKAEDQKIICHAILGHDLTETYSNARIRLAANREEVQRLMSVDLSEMYSPERVSAVCASYGLRPGQAMDIKNGFDFDLAADRKKAWEHVMKDEPTLVIGSPPCTYFSRLQELNKHMYKDSKAWMDKFEANLERAKRHVRFCIKIYKYQKDHGRYFLHEHPWLATSWTLPEMTKLEAENDVQRVRTDMCQFGMMSRVGGVGSGLGPVLKPTGFLTNSPYISKELARRCDRSHQHVPLVAGRAAAAAIYPHGLCCAICRGLAAQIEANKGRRISSPMLDKRGLNSLLSLCREATSEESRKGDEVKDLETFGKQVMEMVQETQGEAIDPVGLLQRTVRDTISSFDSSTDDSQISEFDLNVIQMEVEGEQQVPTGRFRRKRLNRAVSPPGNWPEHWKDTVHEEDGHSIEGLPEDREGENLLRQGMYALYTQAGVEYAVDDVSGAMLDPKLVRKGRDTEMEFFNGMKVYDRVPRSEQAQTGGKIIGTKWIDVNKGDLDRPNIRCRLVGKEFRTTPDDALYASTPPLEALRLIVSRAATIDKKGAPREMMINDVSRAYFYAEATRIMYIELPKEDPFYDPSMLGRLRLCLYGTRDAALNWQQTLSDHLVDSGFKRGVGHPSVFYHPAKDIWTLVHGDDYCSAGPASSLDWLEGLLADRYEIKTQRIGEGKQKNGEEKKKEGQVLNRVVRLTEHGWELEADLRHAELIVEQLGLKDGKSVATPGISSLVVQSNDNDEDDDDSEPLCPSDATVYRAIAARCNYLQPDRPDIQYAVKECCRLMQKPTQRAWEMLKRIGRYLRGKPRLVWQYVWQSEVDVVDAHCDANWAGCKKSRKSSSGGTLSLGSHLIKAYSKTQAVIAKSSGESELYGVVKVSTEALGVSTLLEDFGMKDVAVRVGIDANAAMGIVQRRGLNKLRHVELDVLWVQEQQARRLMPLRKVPGPQNPSDLMTKNVSQTQIDQYVHILNLKFVEGRAEIAQQLHVLAKGSQFSSAQSRVSSVCVDSLVRSVALGCKSVGGEDPSRGRSQRNPSNSRIAGKDVSEPGSLNRLHIDTLKVPVKTRGTAEDRHVDSWSKEGKDGRWTRAHRTARRALFTPMKVAGGPGTKTPLKKLRITRGKFLDSGRTFKIIDDWTVRANAHRVLEGTWLGTTDFRESTECIDDDSDEEVEETEVKEEEDDKPEVEYFELSPAKSSATTTHPEELLTLKLEAKGKSDSGRLALLEARGQPISLSTPTQGLRVEGECGNPPGVHSSRLVSPVFAIGPIGSSAASRSDSLRSPAPLQGCQEKGWLVRCACLPLSLAR
jgi:hypothetical protein